MSSVMSRIAALIGKASTGKFSMVEVQAIIEGYEQVWRKDKKLWLMYGARVSCVQKMLVEVGAGRAFTDTTSREIHIVSTYPVPLVKVIPLKMKNGSLHKAVISYSKTSGYHDMVDSILFEMGNCKLRSVKGIRDLFYSGMRSLTEVGVDVAEAEAENMWEYVQLMRVIPRKERAYQTNRNVYVFRGARKISDVCGIFVKSPHDESATSGAATLSSGERYSLEAIVLADYKDVMLAVANIGRVWLGIKAQSAAVGSWKYVVDRMLTKVGGGPRKEKYAVWYICVLELISALEPVLSKTKRTVPPGAIKDWMFTNNMISQFKLVPRCRVVLSDLRVFMIDLNKSWGLLGPCLSDKELRALSGKYFRVG